MDFFSSFLASTGCGSMGVEEVSVGSGGALEVKAGCFGLCSEDASEVEVTGMEKGGTFGGGA